MATIPIEITIQDQASPITPTPSTNTDTNITVPDTGAGTIGSNGTFSSSSVASIIVPVVLLVLALATVCTLLIRRHHKRQDSKASKKEKLVASISTTAVVLSATALLGNLIMPATKAATSDSELAIEVPDKISIVVNREDDTTEATTEATAYITSTAAFGYKVLLSMADGIDTANLYLDGDTTSQYYIAPSEGEELGANTWGYMLPDEEVYNAIPLVEDAVTTTKGYNNVVDEGVSINYGVKVDKDLPVGTYMGEIEYATGNAIEYMQDFATLTTEEKSSVLASMPDGKQYQLKDTRDEKQYFISKLADGNVWMTQNLDLDLSTTKELTPSDTDIAENWTPSSTTINFSGTTVEGWVNSNTAPYSANPGDIHYYTSGTTEKDIQYNSLVDCEAAGHTDCQHYHAGNYYNWSAAVASNDTSDLTEDYFNAPNSVCPAGWRLPKNANADSYIVGNEQITEINSYDGILGEHNPYGPRGGSYSYLDNGLNTIRINPLWLVRSNGVYDSLLDDDYSYGRYLSSTISTERFTYSLYFDAWQVSPSYMNYRGQKGKDGGYSIRCLAR